MSQLGPHRRSIRPILGVMRYVEVDGLRVSVIGLGTWQFGTREWGYGHEYAHQVAPDLVHRATDLGITLIDTAESYGPTAIGMTDTSVTRRTTYYYTVTAVNALGESVATGQVSATAR